VVIGSVALVLDMAAREAREQTNQISSTIDPVSSPIRMPLNGKLNEPID
jgi:hypothetical protein